MTENTKRSLFGLHGIAGVMISIVGLLVILITLMIFTVNAQRQGVVKPYDPAPIRNVNNLKMISVENKNFAFQEKDKK